MKINVEENNSKCVSIKIPNWLIFNRLGIGFLTKSLLKSGKLGVTVGKIDGEAAPLDVQKIPDKKEFKSSLKKMKRSLGKNLGEICAFFKRNPGFVVADVVEADGDKVKIIF